MIPGGPSTAVMKAAIDTQTPFIGPMAGAPAFRRPFQLREFVEQAWFAGGYAERVGTADQQDVAIPTVKIYDTEADAWSDGPALPVASILDEGEESA